MVSSRYSKVQDVGQHVAGDKVRKKCKLEADYKGLGSFGFFYWVNG